MASVVQFIVYYGNFVADGGSRKEIKFVSFCERISYFRFRSTKISDKIQLNQKVDKNRTDELSGYTEFFYPALSACNSLKRKLFS
jgi:hypothetical protein